MCVGFACFIVTLDSFHSLFILECYEDVHWRHESTKLSLFAFLVYLVLLLYDCSFKIVHFLPVHVCYSLSSFPEHRKKFWIVEGNRHDGYFDFAFLHLVAEVRQSLEALLDLVPEPRLESNHFGFKFKSVAALTDGLVLAFAPLVVLIAFLTTDAKVIAKFEPFKLFSLLVLIVELISNVNFDSVVA